MFIVKQSAREVVLNDIDVSGDAQVAVEDLTVLVSVKTNLHSNGAHVAMFFVDAFEATPGVPCERQLKMAALSAAASLLYLARSSLTPCPSPSSYTQPHRQTSRRRRRNG